MGSVTDGCIRRAGQRRANYAIGDGRTLAVLICGETRGEERRTTALLFCVTATLATGRGCAVSQRLVPLICGARIAGCLQRSRVVTAIESQAISCRRRPLAGGRGNADISHGLSRSEEMS